MQLNLFQWETIETGEGYQNLSRLNFAEARRHFAQALVINPDHQGARRGQEETAFWEESLNEADPLPPENALVLLWEADERVCLQRLGISSGLASIPAAPPPDVFVGDG